MANILTGKIKPVSTSGGSAQNVVSVNLSTDYGAVGDGVTDDTNAFMNMQSELLSFQIASANPVSFYITAPGGKYYVVTNNRWLWGLRRVVVDFGGSQYQNVSSRSGANEPNYPLYSNRNPFNTTAINVFPQSGLVPGYLINTANPGDLTLTMARSVDAANFYINRYVMIYSYDQEFNGQPPNVAFCDYAMVTAINTGTGVLTLDRSVMHLHANYYPDIQNSQGPCGRARVAVIDRPDIPTCESLKLSNMVILPNPNITSNPAPWGSNYLLITNTLKAV